MKHLFFLFILSTISFAQTDTTYRGLIGFEDSQSNTHLFYTKAVVGASYKIFHFNISQNSERKIFEATYTQINGKRTYVGTTRYAILDSCIVGSSFSR
ncbi:MAG: hypothetical protein KJ799_12015 [Bacteroidetes bacterium]|nr:hypothetical protein [Bacteroidota bacterium]MBU1677596.1 hypothetical protein [Bacteroidota bacterium]MBU2507430.1 hypothetical protein [Bacteroidota bacterium]